MHRFWETIIEPLHENVSQGEITEAKMLRQRLGESKQTLAMLQARLAALKHRKATERKAFREELAKTDQALVTVQARLVALKLALAPVADAPSPKIGVRKHNVLVVAHIAAKMMYGAERSLLDVIQCFDPNKFTLFCVFPAASPPLFDKLRGHCQEIITLRYQWTKGLHFSPETIEKFRDLITTRDIDLVYVNTVMLREPLLAAQSLHIPGVVHVREIIDKDPALTEVVGLPSDSLVENLKSCADYIIANSEATRQLFNKGAATFLVYNGIDTEELNLQAPAHHARLRVGLISSNRPKKGIYDFVKLAQLAYPRFPHMDFLLIGEKNRYISDLEKEQQQGRWTPNLYFLEYQPNPLDCYKSLDVVVNFSHFAESFGRTVAEAMACRRPVIGYEWGALPEIVSHGQSGYLIPYLHYERALAYLEQLDQNRNLLRELGTQGRERVVQNFSLSTLRTNLNGVFDAILSRQGESVLPLPPPPLVNGDRSRPPATTRHTTNDETEETCSSGQHPDNVSVVVPNYNYSKYLPERLGSIIGQSMQPLEVIFLDDASDDDSVDVAKSILQGSSIPFTIIRNEKNKGTYHQWLKGLSLAKGDYVWIAEADDTCDTDFLRSLVNLLDDDRVSIAYCQSRKIDENGVLISPDNLAHTNEIDPQKWREDYTELGVREVVNYLVYRNTIPSVSACLLRKEAVRGIESELATFRYCGDWLLYAHMLKGGNVGYVSQPLSAFRRHSSSVTQKQGKRLEYLREIVRVREYICNNFPIHPSQLPRMDFFLDKDYRVDGVAKNSACLAVKDGLDCVVARVAPHRRIAFITTNNGSYDGGSEVLWRQTAEKVRALGHDVVVLIKQWSPRPRFFDEFGAAGIKLYFKESDGITSIISFQPDLVVISIGDQDEGIEYYKNLKEHNLRYVIVNQLTKEEKYWPIRPNRVDDVKAGYLGAERVFFTCKNNHRVMESRLHCRIPNWDIHYNPYHIERDAVPAFPPVSDGVKLAVPAKILFLHKGQDLLMEVFKSEKWKRRDIVINVYGEGPDKARLEQMARDYGVARIVFHGREADIARIWRDNQAIVMPSRMEGLPIMLVSAMISARVPIVTDIGGHAEVIEDGVSGFLASSPSVDALDDALERAFCVSDQWETIGRRARQRILAYLPEDPVGDFVRKIFAILSVPLGEVAFRKHDLEQGVAS